MFNRRTLLMSGAALAVTPRPAWASTNDAVNLIQGKIDSRELEGAVLHVTHKDNVTAHAFGKCTAKSVFYLASLTKPMVATAVMMLVERKQVALNDLANKYIPELTGGERDKITVKHLLTHTSGLPDMLPENEKLRARHAPLADYVALTCKSQLLYSPGTECRYQSMGILLAGELLQRITGKTLADFMKNEIFSPLGMKDSSMGLGDRKLEDTVQLQHDEQTDWAQNSAYWRNLHAPWADVHATAADVSIFANFFLKPDGRLFKPETATMMITNQNTLPVRPWGIGWSFGNYGKNSSAKACGHSGSSGTSMWIDPEKELSCVLLTSLPARYSASTVIAPVNYLISAQ